MARGCAHGVYKQRAAASSHIAARTPFAAARAARAPSAANIVKPKQITLAQHLTAL